MLLPLLFGMIVGTLLGATGAGGAVLAVPLLIWGVGCSLEDAAPIALLGVAAGSTLGTVLSWSVAQVRYRAAALMGFGSLFGAPLALWVAQWITRTALEALFAVVLAIVAARLLAPAPHPRTSLRLCRLDPASGRISWNGGTIAYVTTTGAVAGALAALLGVGGGFVIVPSLRTFSDLPVHAVVATSLMAVAIISTVALFAGVLGGTRIGSALAAPFVIGTLTGTLLSRKLMAKAAPKLLQSVLGVALLLAAAGMAARAAGVA